MQQYLELLRKIKNEGHLHEDRTGVGRQSIFGAQLRFDLSQGKLPVVTTRKIYLPAIIHELLWFIRGQTDNSLLVENKVNIWSHWAVGLEHIKAFFINRLNYDAAYVNSDDFAQQLQELKTPEGLKLLNQIGPMYGYLWRNAPGTNRNIAKLDTLHEDKDTFDSSYKASLFREIPSDKMAQYQQDYRLTYNKDSSGDEQDLDFVDYAVEKYTSTIDQLNNLILNLKKRPFSSRHIVTAWIPQFVAFEDISPQENVLAGRGALAPCHAFFQCFVSPPKNEGGKHRLSLLMYQRSSDYPVGVCLNIASYALLTAMLAHVTDMEPHEFIWTSGDTHAYSNQLDLIDEQLSREPMELPDLWINPEVKDLFQFKYEDIEIRNYQSHPAIKYPVAI